MPIVINTNVASLNAQGNLTKNTNALTKSFEKLASGYRINRAADDAAGLQISETLRAQTRGVNQAINNAQDGYNLLSVAEGSLSVIQDNLQRIRELTVQAANDTNGDAQREAITQEINARLSDIDRIANATEFNGKKLLNNASVGDRATFLLQIGANDDVSLDTLNIGSALVDATASAGLGIASSSVDLTTNSAARNFLGLVDAALETVGQTRATIGSFQNRLESAIQNLQVTSENFSAAESRIRNVDVAKETSELTKNQILQQAATSILTQANSSTNLAMTLLRGG